MPDGSNYIAAAAAEPPKPELPRTGQLRDDDTPYLSFQALLGGAIKATPGSVRSWSIFSRPITTDELIDLNTEGELRHTGVALRDTQAEPGRRR